MAINYLYIDFPQLLENHYFLVLHTDIHNKKNHYYLRIFIHKFKFVDKFSIIYEYCPEKTLSTDIAHKSEFVGKLSITYQLLHTNFITYQLLPTDLYYLPIITYRSLLPINYYSQISITYQLLPTNLYQIL